MSIFAITIYKYYLICALQFQNNANLPPYLHKETAMAAVTSVYHQIIIYFKDQILLLLLHYSLYSYVIKTIITGNHHSVAANIVCTLIQQDILGNLITASLFSHFSHICLKYNLSLYKLKVLDSYSVDISYVYMLLTKHIYVH